MSDRDAAKRAAAEAAAALVQDGMKVGLGTGSTAYFAIEALIRRVRDGLDIVAIATSERSAAQARQGGIPMTTFGENPHLDLTIDGADEIQRGTLQTWIKGLGGALFARENRRRRVRSPSSIVADAPKLVDRLGGTATCARCTGSKSLPFGWENQLRPASPGNSAPILPLRRTQARRTVPTTDGGNLILDCHFGPIADPAGHRTSRSARRSVWSKPASSSAWRSRRSLRTDQFVREITGPACR